MRTVYISYREEDSGPETDALFEQLKSVYGVTNVHRTSTHAEINIPDVQYVIGRHDVLLVVIGPYWAQLVDERGAPLYLQHDDPVRVELATATHLHMPILPILVGKAEMPEKDILPKRLHGLFTFAPVRLEPIDDAAISDLRERIELAVMNRPRRKTPSTAQRIRRRFVSLAIVALLVLMGVLFFFGQDRSSSGRPTPFIEPSAVVITMGGNPDSLSALATEQRLHMTPTNVATRIPSDRIFSGGGSIQIGAVLFNTRMPTVGYACADCHSADPDGALQGPNLTGLGARVLAGMTYQEAVTYLYNAIVVPEAEIVGSFPTTMPTTYGLYLSDPDIRNLIVYLLSL